MYNSKGNCKKMHEALKYVKRYSNNIQNTHAVKRQHNKEMRFKFGCNFPNFELMSVKADREV